MKKIMFTGHRNAKTSIKCLKEIAKRIPNVTWIHGGAKGFDEQVEKYAIENNIKTEVFKPDYKFGKAAPLIRNKKMIESADLVIACYDGRKSGGTNQSILYAFNKGKNVFFVVCILDSGEIIDKPSDWEALALCIN